MAAERIGYGSPENESPIKKYFWSGVFLAVTFAGAGSGNLAVVALGLTGTYVAWPKSKSP